MQDLLTACIRKPIRTKKWCFRLKKEILNTLGALKNIWQKSKSQPNDFYLERPYPKPPQMPNDISHFEEEESFKTWFTGSKVVNKQGDPLIVCHATSANIDNFFPYSHFGTLAAAEHMANRARSGKSAAIYPVILDIKNPIEIEDNGNHPIDYYYRVLQEQGILTSDEVEGIRANILPVYPFPPGLVPDCENFYPDEIPLSVIETHRSIHENYVRLYECYIEELKNEDFYSALGWNPQNVHGQRLAKTLLDKGYDGFKYVNMEEDQGSISWTILHHSQVRSALDGQPFRAGKPFADLKPEILEYLIEEREEMLGICAYQMPNMFMESEYLNHQKPLDMFDRIIEKRHRQEQGLHPL